MIIHTNCGSNWSNGLREDYLNEKNYERRLGRTPSDDINPVCQVSSKIESSHHHDLYLLQIPVIKNVCFTLQRVTNDHV